MTVFPHDGLNLKSMGNFSFFEYWKIYIKTECYILHRFMMPLKSYLKQPSSVFYLPNGKVFAMLEGLIATYLFFGRSYRYITIYLY